MRRKVGTVLDEALFRRARLESARQGRAISEILAEALEGYLEQARGGMSASSVVADTWSVLSLDRARVKKILGARSRACLALSEIPRGARVFLDAAHLPPSLRGIVRGVPRRCSSAANGRRCAA